MNEALAKAIKDGKSYHLFTRQGAYTGISFYFHKSAENAAHVVRFPCAVKFITNEAYNPERSIGNA